MSRMDTVPQTVLTLAFVYQTLARVTRCRIPNIARATDPYNNQHRPAQLRHVAHLANGVGLRVDHITSTEYILTNGDQAS
jgi:hypothetical protein